MFKSSFLVWLQLVDCNPVALGVTELIEIAKRAFLRNMPINVTKFSTVLQNAVASPVNLLKCDSTTNT